MIPIFLPSSCALRRRSERQLPRCQTRRTGLLLVLLLSLPFSVGCPNGRQPGGVVDGTKTAASNTVGHVTSKRPESGIRFSDVTSDSGVAFAYENGRKAGNYTMVESLGGGLAVSDFDRDGLPDLLFAGGGKFDGEEILGLPASLFRNLGNLHFDNVTTAAADGFAPRVYNHAVLAADCDADGFTDFAITGYGGVQLWLNQGDGTFRESNGLAEDTLWSSGGAWGDYNCDGHLDLYLTHYVDWSFDNHPYCPGSRPGQRDICPPRQFGPLPDRLYFSNGDGTFRGADKEIGLKPEGKGLGALAADVDHDGDVDIYVANDTTDNYLYINDGSGLFREFAMESGVAVDNMGIPNGSMGMDIFDFNRDGRVDIWVANYEREDFALYRNEGAAQFLHVSRTTGLSVLGGLFVGFGTACEDFDLDGDEDIVVANGHVILFPAASPLRQLPLVLENQDARFRRLRFAKGDYFEEAHEGRGLATGDLDRDGDADLVVSHLLDPVAVLRNDCKRPGRWLQARLVGVRSNRDGIGATLTLRTSAGNFVRQMIGGGSYLSTCEPIVTWGLEPDLTIDSLEVRWPSGAVSVMSAPEPGRRHTIVEPRS